MILIAQKVQCFIQNYESHAVNIIKSSDQMRRNCLFLSTCLGAFLSNLCPRCSSGYFGNLPHLYSAHFLFFLFFPFAPQSSLLLYLWTPPVGKRARLPTPLPHRRLLSVATQSWLIPSRQAGRQEESRTHHPHVSYHLKLLFSFLSLCVAGRHRVYVCNSISIIHVVQDF